jgi:hypothetical protein
MQPTSRSTLVTQRARRSNVESEGHVQCFSYSARSSKDHASPAGTRVGVETRPAISSRCVAHPLTHAARSLYSLVATHTPPSPRTTHRKWRSWRSVWRRQDNCTVLGSSQHVHLGQLVLVSRRSQPRRLSSRRSRWCLVHRLYVRRHSKRHSSRKRRSSPNVFSAD